MSVPAWFNNVTELVMLGAVVINLIGIWRTRKALKRFNAAADEYHGAATLIRSVAVKSFMARHIPVWMLYQEMTGYRFKIIIENDDESTKGKHDA